MIVLALGTAEIPNSGVGTGVIRGGSHYLRLQPLTSLLLTPFRAPNYQSLPREGIKLRLLAQRAAKPVELLSVN